MTEFGNIGGPNRAPRTSENAAFDAYLALARARPGLWRIAATLLILVIFEFLVLSAISFAVYAAGDRDLDLLRDPGGQLIVTLAALASAPIALAFALNVVHGRSFSSLLGASRRLEARELLIGAGASIALSVVGLALTTSLGLLTASVIEDYRPPWALLIAVLLLVPWQAAGEELVFRGYLLQEIGVRLPFAVAWAGAPSLLFALLHFGGGDTELEAVAYMASTFLFGLFAAALVWRTAGLSAAIGFHVTNNWVALCLFEPPQGVDGLGPLALRYTDGGVLPALALDALTLTLALAILWRLMPKKSPSQGG